MIILFTVTDKCSNPENFVPDCVAEIEYEFDNCKSFKKRIEKFEQDLRIFEKESDNSFFNAIFYLNGIEFIEDNDKFLQIFGENFLSKLHLLKPELKLNLCLSTFETQYHIINDLLMEKNLFLRFYELRRKFRYLIKELPNGKNSVKRDLLACVEEPFNGFHIIRQLSQYE